MEPRIQYATTSDGVKIAFSVIGHGPPLIVQAWGPAHTHLELEWGIAEARRWYERLAENRTVIRLDYRGSGLSERKVASFSLDNWLLDLEAVVQRLSLERFALFGGFDGGLLAVAYAARHPESVSDLILWCSTACRRDITESTGVQAIRALWQHEWDDYAELVTHMAFGWSEGDLAHRYAPIIRDSTTQGNSQKAYREIDTFDVSDLLPQVKAPTLVMHRRDCPFPRLESGRALAMGIPDASFRIVEGRALAPFVGDWQAILQEVNDFLPAGKTPQTSPMPAGLHTILFTDIEGSTALTDRLGDAAAREVLREHERITREALEAHGGSEVKTMGDGFMASFGSATKALECAIAIQKAFDVPDSVVGAEQLPDDIPIRDAGPAVAQPLRHDTPIRVRIGLNAGEPIAEDDDLFGTAVIVAARIAAQAHGGEILVSDVVRQLVAGKGFLFNDRGEHALKGFEDPVRVWEVRWFAEE